MYCIDVCNRQSALAVDQGEMRQLVESVLEGEGIQHAEVSLAVVTDQEIHQLNLEFLRHDYPTDVLSFVLAREGDQLDGEVVVSAEMAATRCREFGWQPLDELRLYVIHGMLHLIGFRDKTDSERGLMQQREDHYMQLLGKRVPRQDATRSTVGSRATQPGTGDAGR